MENNSKHLAFMYICKRPRMNKWLQEKGYTPVGTVVSEDGSKRINWLYEWTPQFDVDKDLYFSIITSKNKD